MRTLIKLVLLVGADALLPIDDNTYTLVTNAKGLSGPCRGGSATAGVGGWGVNADKVNGRSKGGMTQVQCENECNGDSKCVGYGYSGAANNGECVIYGPEQAGTCSIDTVDVEPECGTCSIETQMMESTCGTCNLEGFPKAGWAPTESLCVADGGEWTAATWTGATWTGPKEGWTGMSHHTTYVGEVVHVATWFCFDKLPYDDIMQCTGGDTCQMDFMNKLTEDDCGKGCGTEEAPCTCTFKAGSPPTCTTVDQANVDPSGRDMCSINFYDQLEEADCTGAGCTPVPAPTYNPSLKMAHSPVIQMPGWNGPQVCITPAPRRGPRLPRVRVRSGRAAVLSGWYHDPARSPSAALRSVDDHAGLDRRVPRRRRPRGGRQGHSEAQRSELL